MNFFRIFQAQSGIGEYHPPQGIPVAGNADLGTFFATAADKFLLVAGIIAVALLVVGGIQYAAAAGDEEKQARAKATIKWTIIGLVLALAAYSIVVFVTDVLG